MAVKTTHREQVRAFATGNLEKANELNMALPDEERSAYNQFQSAVFAVFLEHRFKDDLTRDAMAGFAQEIARDFANTDVPPKVWTIEGVIRAACGEPHLFDEIDPEDVLGTQILVIGKLAMHDPEVSADLDAYLDEAESLVAEWEREE